MVVVVLSFMYYWKTCGSGGLVFHENVLGEDMCSRWACLTGLCKSCNCLSCCEFRKPVCCCCCFFTRARAKARAVTFFLL